VSAQCTTGPRFKQSAVRPLADSSRAYGIRRFARTLLQDLTAVRNAITETSSNGQTEGETNRLKTLKRAMYGSAGVDLHSLMGLLGSDISML
jgi:transposase